MGESWGELRDAWAALTAARIREERAIADRRAAQELYRVRMRALRVQRGMSLSALARTAKVTKAHASDVELGRRWSDHLACVALEVLQ